jgi:hypothetical protein
MPPRYTFIGGTANTPKEMFGMPYAEFCALDPDEQLDVWSGYLHKDDKGPCQECGFSCLDGVLCDQCRTQSVKE